MRTVATLALLAALQAGAGPLLSPYKDVTIGLDPARPAIARDAWPGRGAPPVLTWAFATGECGEERWGAFDSAEFARLSVAAFVAAGRGYIVATGGEAGIFTCASDAAMARFVARYDSPQLVGLDFDIEGKQTSAQIDSLVRRAAALQRARPELRISFTLATHAASDGTTRSLNATGEQVLQAIVGAGFQRAIVNLMVMNYGPADARWCTLAPGASPPRCDMAASALQAARHVKARYGIPFARIALTPMLGENDVAGNVTGVDDLAAIARGARELGLAGVHYWSLDRDRPCPAGAPRVSPQCHALPDVAPGRFGAAAEAGLGAPAR